jgi:hypothetical protein
MSEGLVQRRRKNVADEKPEDEEHNEDTNSDNDDRSTASKLTLMEEILLLGLKDREVSFFVDI